MRYKLIAVIIDIIVTISATFYTVLLSTDVVFNYNVYSLITPTLLETSLSFLSHCFNSGPFQTWCCFALLPIPPLERVKTEP